MISILANEHYLSLHSANGIDDTEFFAIQIDTYKLQILMPLTLCTILLQQQSSHRTRVFQELQEIRTIPMIGRSHLKITT